MNSTSFEPIAPIHSSIRPPGSKSISNRAFVCAALAHGVSRLSGVLDADDTRYMVDSLRRLGFKIEVDWGNARAIVEGANGKIPATQADLFIGNSGTCVRFLTAMCANGAGTYRLDGDDRMNERPIADLIDALSQLGVRVESLDQSGCPPVIIHAKGIKKQATRIKGNLSSQFISALMMAAPVSEQGINIELIGEPVSRPYLSMTKAVMGAFGAECILPMGQNNSIEVPNRGYRGCDYEIEPDASAASYFWAAAAIAGGSATVEGLNPSSIQGDTSFVNCLNKMGCEIVHDPHSITVRGPARHGIEIDMSDISDTAQTLAVVALFVEGPTTIRGIAHNRVKETDRIGNLAIELRKIGAIVEEFDDGLTITPGSYQPATIATYNDHRMAMSLSLAGLKQPGTKILDPECTRKTYPEFFSQMREFLNS